MSWIFGFYSKDNFNSKSLKKYHPDSIVTAISSNYYIAAGGNKNTLLFNETLESGNGYFVCGIMISKKLNKILNKNDLDLIFNSESNEIHDHNGHFCGVFISNNTLHLFTDKLGLREIHIYENDRGWYFSTRLDWLLKLGNFEIDFSEFGSRWLSINQISSKSIIRKITRLNCGAKAKIENSSLIIEEVNWQPSLNLKSGFDEFTQKLRKLILLGSNNQSKISLSLSGGMDSRVILSFLLNNNYDKWNCHTFANDSMSDLDIAKRITEKLNLDHEIIRANSSEENIITNLREYVGSTYLTESAFISQSLNLYSYLDTSHNELIIDGGFGEIWRRSFLTRLYHFGQKYIELRDFEKIASFLRYNRADLFHKEVNETMYTGVIKQLDTLNSQLPSVTEIGIGNWLDLFSLRTRLVNYYAPEQNRIDQYVKSYMPFVQLSLVNLLFAIPANQRKNDRLFKKIIEMNSKELSKFGIAKADTVFPYWFTPLMRRLYSEIITGISKVKVKNRKDIYLQQIKNFVLDTLNSSSLKNYSPYNHNLIKERIIEYYQGELEKRNYVDWFVTFEIFRQILLNMN